MSNTWLFLLAAGGATLIGLGYGLIYSVSVTPGFGLIVGLGAGLILGSFIVAFRKK